MSKRKLLLADDSVTIQKVVNLTFADEGIEVISVGDGDSAMEKVAEVSPDLIMADVNMPGLTGYEICERIRQDDNLRRTPVILLVGSFEPFDEDEARRVGADDYLTKPFQSIRQLVNKVTVLLETRISENGDAANNAGSLDDTLEMDVADLSANVSASPKFEDTGYDDEMIQTNQPVGFAFDETQKFESRETGELSNPPQFEGYNISEKDSVESIITESETEFINDEVLETQTIKTDFEDYKEDSSASEEVGLELNEEDTQIDKEAEREFSYGINEPEDTIYEITNEESQTAEFEKETESISEYSAKSFFYETDELENKENVSYEIKDDSGIEIQESDEFSEAIDKPIEKLVRIDDAPDEETEVDESEIVEDFQQKVEISDSQEADSLENEPALEITEEQPEKSDGSVTEEIINESGEIETSEKNEESTEEDINEYSNEIEESSNEISIDAEENQENGIVENVSEEVLETFDEDSEVVKDYAFVSDEKIDRFGSPVSSETEIPTEVSETTDSSVITDDEESNENIVSAQKMPEEEIPLPEFASVLELDDDDILQLPPFENELEFEESTSSDERGKFTAANNVGFVSETKIDSKYDSTSFSDELIELIVAKVLERLTDKAVKEVAWEVVPHLTEVIVKKMAEEKLKD